MKDNPRKVRNKVIAYKSDDYEKKAWERLKSEYEDVSGSEIMKCIMYDEVFAIGKIYKRRFYELVREELATDVAAPINYLAS